RSNTMRTTLDEWLEHSHVASELAQMNAENLNKVKVLGSTTRTQVIDILKMLRSLILPGLFDREPIGRKQLDALLADEMHNAADTLFMLIRRVLVHTCND